MTRILFAKGASGDIIRAVQEKLDFTGTNLDGAYGNETAKAVAAWQQNRNLDSSGAIDTLTWPTLMNAPIPTIEQRALQLTARFEGHGYGLAQGNFDGAGITWGIIGFTLASGSLGTIVQAVNDNHPDLIRQAFGSITAPLLNLLSMPLKKQLAFAGTLSSGPNNARLAEPWRTAFAAFGAFPEVQAQQIALAHQRYFAPALRSAESLGLKTELGLALMFDCHVQNGGISAEARNQIAGSLNGHRVSTEKDLRLLIAQAVADNARGEYSADVLSRKLTLASGGGSVHGETFLLANWGIAESPYEVV